MNSRDAHAPAQRKPIYIRDGVRQVLAGREADLSTVVNRVAERYAAIIGEYKSHGFTADEMLVLESARVDRYPNSEMLELIDIVGFPSVAKRYINAMADDDLVQNPQSMIALLGKMTLPELVALIDKLERK